MPSFRGIEHLSMTVPDTDAATKAFTGLFGCRTLYAMSPFDGAGGTFMRDVANADVRTVVHFVRALRSPFLNIELFESSSPVQSRRWPDALDVGGWHLGATVADLDEAVAFLESTDTFVLGAGTRTAADGAPRRVRRAMTSFGLHLEDPYAHYAELREAAPVHELGDGRYALFRYDDLMTALRDHRTFASSGARLGGADDGGMADLSIISQDPPAHKRMRHLVTGPFRPAAIASLDKDVRSAAKQLVDDLVAANERGEADFVTQVAGPLPVIAIARMMGIPEERADDFRRWTDAAVAGRAGLDATQAEVDQARADMAGFFGEIIQARRAEPRDDLISAVLGGDDPLNDIELLVFCFTLLVAGNETTTNLIGDAMLALLAEDAVREALWAEPELVPTVIEEALRFDPPAQGTTRRTTEDVTVDGHTIPAESIVEMVLGSGNRDPRRYDDPDTFSLTRDVRDHLAFGNGIHLCLGAHLARLEARAVYDELVARVTDIEIRGPVVRQLGQLRGVRELPVSFTAR